MKLRQIHLLERSQEMAGELPPGAFGSGSDAGAGGGSDGDSGALADTACGTGSAAGTGVEAMTSASGGSLSGPSLGIAMLSAAFPGTTDGWGGKNVLP